MLLLLLLLLWLLLLLIFFLVLSFVLLLLFASQRLLLLLLKHVLIVLSLVATLLGLSVLDLQRLNLIFVLFSILYYECSYYSSQDVKNLKTMHPPNRMTTFLQLLARLNNKLTKIFLKVQLMYRK